MYLCVSIFISIFNFHIGVNSGENRAILDYISALSLMMMVLC